MFLIKEIQYIKINKDKYLILNLINWAADYIDKDIYEKIFNNSFSRLDKSIIDIMKERKYLFENKNEYQNFLKKLDSRIEDLEKNSNPNFLIIPSYACNLNCTYCYEQTYQIKHSNIIDKKKIIDKQFKIIDDIVKKISQNKEQFSNKDVKITIMWGEPLMLTNKSIINHILKKVEINDYRANIITNWIDITSFIPYLKSNVVEYIQITLDGTKDIHDKRRIFHDWRGSFDIIMSNINEIIKNWIKTQLRVNVDKKNIKNLPELANLIVDKFKDMSNLHPYIYILQDWWCSWEQNIVEENVAIKDIFEMEKKYPNMSVFRKKFHAANFIESIFNNKAFQPSLRHCWASKNQYILDYKGNIYKCRHWIGNENYRVGTFDNKYEFNEKNNLWHNRSINNLKKCNSCIYRYICGTGCPAAKHKGGTHLDINKPNCVDYENLINSLILEYINKT